MTAGQLRVEQLHEILARAQAVRRDRSRRMRTGGRRRAVPVAHELGEVRIADFGAVDVLVTGGNRADDGVHGADFGEDWRIFYGISTAARRANLAGFRNRNGRTRSR